MKFGKNICHFTGWWKFCAKWNEDSTNCSRIPWKSFDYLTGTLIMGMKLRFNWTGKNWSLTLWRSNNFPILGSFNFGIDPNNTNQLVIWWKGKIFWRSGEWQEKEGTFKLSPRLSTPYREDHLENQYFNGDSDYDVDYNFHYKSTAEEVYFSYSVNKSMLYLGPTQQLPRLTITPWGEVGGGVDANAVSHTSNSNWHV